MRFFRAGAFVLLVTLALGINTPASARPTPGKKRFHLLEATIDEVHDAIARQEITCDELVGLYLARIKAYNGVCVNQPDGVLGRHHR